MKAQEFDKVLEDRITSMRGTLAGKAEEYASDNDRLHNFKVAARMESKPQTPEQALWGMLKKHLVSVVDIVDMTATGNCPSEWLRNEKIGDAINYLVLLEALLVEREEATEQIKIAVGMVNKDWKKAADTAVAARPMYVPV